VSNEGHDLSRRGFVATACAASAGCAGIRTSSWVDPASGEVLHRLVQAYSDLGDHRTGSAGDHATTVWLERSLAGLGLSPERQAWDLDVFDVALARLSWSGGLVDGSAIEGVPLWSPIPTPAPGLIAPLNPVPTAGAITLLTLPYQRAGSLESNGVEAAIAQACGGGAVGVVIITEGPLGELIALNTALHQPPWPVPVLLVPGRTAATLATISERRIPVRLEIAGNVRRETVHNVLGRRRRPGPGLVISTPKSGWFRCAGERGSGMAIALALADWCVRKTDLDVRFVSATGHEFHGAGGHIFLQADAPAPETLALWVHVGANVAVNDWRPGDDGRPIRVDAPATTRGVACHPAIHAAVEAGFADQAGYGRPIDIGAGRVPGETQIYADHGYRPLIGLVGSGPLHHTPGDTAVATSPAVLEPVARGLIEAVRRVLEIRT
jgi:hypothetical protein